MRLQPLVHGLLSNVARLSGLLHVHSLAGSRGKHWTTQATLLARQCRFVRHLESAPGSLNSKAHLVVHAVFAHQLSTALHNNKVYQTNDQEDKIEGYLSRYKFWYKILTKEMV